MIDQAFFIYSLLSSALKKYFNRPKGADLQESYTMKDCEFMYQPGLEDIDRHIWEFSFIDQSKIPTQLP